MSPRTDNSDNALDSGNSKLVMELSKPGKPNLLIARYIECKRIYRERAGRMKKRWGQGRMAFEMEPNGFGDGVDIMYKAGS